jgi:hypothetical protein
MALYMAIPKAAHAVVEVATGTAIKTLLQVALPATTDIRVVAWGVSFKGVVPTNPSGVVTLLDTDVAATVTNLTPEEWGSEENQNSLCVGTGGNLTGYNATAEGTITISRILDGQEVHPQTGYSIWFPSPALPRVKPGRFLRIRGSFTVDVNSIPWILWQEPG